MTAFKQHRIWLRRVSTAERTMTIVAIVIVVALFGWLVTPVHNGSGSDTVQSLGGDGGSTSGGTTGTGTTGAGTNGTGTTGAGTSGTGTTGTVMTGTGTTGTSGSSTGTTGTSGSSTGTTGTTGTTGPTRQCPAAAAGQGVTDKKIDVAITIIDIAGAAGNGVVNVPSPTEQQQDWQQVADSINASGGAACRKLVLHFYTVNPIDSSNAQSQCQRIADDRPFIALDSGALTNVGASDCIPAQKIPLVSTYVNEAQAKAYYPYYISPAGLEVDAYRNGYLGARQKGYFNGLGKLGVVYQNCQPNIVAAGRAALREAGIADSVTVTYNLGCPPGKQTSAADFQQAVLTFKRAGVTHVTEIDDNDFYSFTKIAGQQGFKPHYILASDPLANVTTGALAPDAKNFDGAVDVVGGRYGEQTTPGYKSSAATVRCNAIYAKHGQKPVYQQGAGYGGVVCHYLWFLVALFDHAPRLQRSSLVAGMHSIGLMDSPFIYGPIDFSGVPAGKPWGREFWRVDRFVAACSCYHVDDPTFNPPFA